jgi:hypothetical protein
MLAPFLLGAVLLWLLALVAMLILRREIKPERQRLEEITAQIMAEQGRPYRWSPLFKEPAAFTPRGRVWRRIFFAAAGAFVALLAGMSVLAQFHG